MEDLSQPDSDKDLDHDNAAEPDEVVDTGSDEKIPEPASASRTKVETHRVRPPFLRALAGILAVIIIALLLVLLARWIYHVTHSDNSANTTTSQKSPVSPSNKKTAGSQSAAKNQSSPAGGNSQITNTGPGNVAAVFVGSSLAAAGLHFIWTLRRSRRQA